MSKQFAILRSESKFSDMSPELQKLFDRKHQKIIKAAESEAEEAEKTNDELIKTMFEAIITNAESIQKIIAKQGGLSFTDADAEEEEEESQEENLEKLTKSLEQSGLDVGMVVKGKRVKIS